MTERRFATHFLEDLRSRVSVSEVVARRVKLKKQGREWKGLSPFNGEKTPSFYVNDQKGFYHCFSSGRHGDQFRFIMETEGASFVQAVEVVASMAGLGLPSSMGPVDPKAIAALEARQRRDRDQRDRDQAADVARRMESAEAIWRSTIHLKGTLGHDYFVKRGVSAHHLEMGEMRFHPSLLHPNGKRYPAIVGRVQDVDGKGIAIWRIFLDPKTGLKVAGVEAKLGLGPAAGGAVRLGDDGKADEIAVVEGLETGTAVRELLMWTMPVWCGLSTSGMAGLIVPDRVLFVHIYPDGDKPRSYRNVQGKPVPLPPGETIAPPGITAARKLADRLQHIGRGWNIEPEPEPGADYLDILVESKSLEDASA